jgi:influenza virus NS1A-binding protein
MNCSNCNNKFNNVTHVPRILISCGHTFCELCLSSLMEEASSLISCPTCKVETVVDNVKSLIKNLALLNNSSSINLSQEDIIEGNSSQLLEKSSLSYTATPSTKKLVVKNKPLCEIHSKDLEAFCEVDKEMLCVSCIIENDHKNHDLSSIDKAAQMERAYFEKNMNRALGIGNLLNEKMNEVSKSREHINSILDKRKESINEFFNELINVIKERQELLIRNLEDSVEPENEKLNIQEKGILINLEKISTLKNEKQHIEEMPEFEMLRKSKTNAQLFKDLFSAEENDQNISRNDSFFIPEIRKEDELNFFKKFIQNQIKECQNSNDDFLNNNEFAISPVNTHNVRNDIKINYTPSSDNFNMSKKSSNTISTRINELNKVLISNKKEDRRKLTNNLKNLKETISNPATNCNSQRNSEKLIIQIDKKTGKTIDDSLRKQVEKEYNHNIKEASKKLALQNNIRSSLGVAGNNRKKSMELKPDFFNSIENDTIMNQDLNNSSRDSDIAEQDESNFLTKDSQKNKILEVFQINYNNTEININDIQNESKIKENTKPIQHFSISLNSSINENNNTNKRSSTQSLKKLKTFTVQTQKAEIDILNSTSNIKLADESINLDSFLKENETKSFIQQDLASLYQSISSSIFSFGGKSDKVSRKLNCESKEWSSVKEISLERSDFASVMYKDKKILILGGKVANQAGIEFISDSIYLINLMKSSIIKLEIKLKQAKCEFSAVYSNANKLYICGGFNGRDVLNNFEYFDFSNKRWIELPRMNIRRREFSIIIGVDNCIYAIGGSDDKEIVNKSVERFDMEKNTWSKIDDMNQRRKGFATFCMPDGIYVMGGFDGCQYLKSVEKYDFILKKWKFLPDMNFSKGFSSVACSSDFQYIYSIGGYDGKPLNVIERYDVFNNKWTVWEKMPMARYRHHSYYINE